jgi:hypothetical protein
VPLARCHRPGATGPAPPNNVVPRQPTTLRARFPCASVRRAARHARCAMHRTRRVRALRCCLSVAPSHGAHSAHELPCADARNERALGEVRAGGRKRLRVGRVEAVVEMAAHTIPAHVPHTHTNKETSKQTQTPAATASATATTRRGYGWRLENKEREGLKAGQGFKAATGCAVAMQCIGPVPAAGMGCGEPRASYTEYSRVGTQRVSGTAYGSSRPSQCIV